MKTLFSFLKPYKFAVWIALLLTFVELLVELVQPLLIARIIDDGILEQNLSVVLMWGGVMLGLSAISFLSGISNSFYAAYASQHGGFDLRKKMYDKIQSFSFSKFDLFSTSSLLTRMTNDVTQLTNTVFMSLRIMLRAPMLVIGSVVLAMFVNLHLAFFLLLTIPFLVFILFWMLKKAASLFKKVQEKVDQVNNVVQENLTAIRLIKAFLRRKYESSRFTEASDELRVKTVKSLRLIESSLPIILLVMNVSIMAVLWFGQAQINAGTASVGEVVAIINYVTRMTGALTIFPMIIIIFSRAKASGDRVAEVLEADSGEEDTGRSSFSDEDEIGRIEFENVTFSYPTAEKLILQEVSFTINPGERVAILGATGSGKSSLMQLIPRLYEADSGQVKIGNEKIEAVSMHELRKWIGYVPQESILFTGTIFENLQWGKEDATKEEMIEAAKKAQIHDSIQQLPNGYETIVGQRGVNLSGGQKQRLSIARALIRKPKILLLDDSTSALDVHTERRLLGELRKVECTTLMVTQKISSTKDADQIFLLEDGFLTQRGTHEELLEKSRLYQTIYDSQFGEGEANA